MTSAGYNPNLSYNPAQVGDTSARPDERKSDYKAEGYVPPDPKLGDNNGPMKADVGPFSCVKCWISNHPLESVIIAGAIVYFMSRKKE